jgi:hypothetical protein
MGEITKTATDSTIAAIAVNATNAVRPRLILQAQEKYRRKKPPIEALAPSYVAHKKGGDGSQQL